MHVEASSDVFDIITSECPDKQDKDNCESACCCAEHTPFVFTAQSIRFRQSGCADHPDFFYLLRSLFPFSFPRKTCLDLIFFAS